jgi:hypothetical protein
MNLGRLVRKTQARLLNVIEKAILGKRSMHALFPRTKDDVLNFGWQRDEC